MKDYDSHYFSRFSIDPDSDISELYNLDDFNLLETEIAEDFEKDIYVDTSGDGDLSELR